MIKRRQFLYGTAAGAALLSIPFFLKKSPAVADYGDITPVILTDEEWKAKLSDKEYNVLREAGTERPGTSPYNSEKREGTYVCKGCEFPLFTSHMKYDSGTGWPSFFDVIDGHVETKRDFVLLIPRTEYHCRRCGGHQGHRFEDGPPPTGYRYCNNGVALKFIPA